MSANGYEADPVSMTAFAGKLKDIAKQLDSTIKSYKVDGVEFGQDSDVDFPEAHLLHGAYDPRLGDHKQSVADLVGWVHTMADVADVISKRYKTVEDLGKASAADIKKALQDALMQADPTKLTLQV